MERVYIVFVSFIYITCMPLLTVSACICMYICVHINEYNSI